MSRIGLVDGVACGIVVEAELPCVPLPVLIAMPVLLAVGFFVVLLVAGCGSVFGVWETVQEKWEMRTSTRPHLDKQDSRA